MYKTYEKYSTSLNVRLIRGLLFPLLKILLITFLLYLFISNLLLVSFKVESISMQPTLKENERILVSPLIFGAKLPFSSVRLPGLKKMERGDLVVVDSPLFTRPAFPVSVFEPLIRFFSLQKKTLVRDFTGKKTPKYQIKRIIGLPGDTIKIHNFAASIKPRGVTFFYNEHELINVSYTLQIDPLPETWKEEFPFSGNLEEITLKENQYFLLGDNRPASSDSRSWGPLNDEQIFGKVFFKYWPVKQSGRL